MKGVFRKMDDKTLVAASIEAMEALAAVHLCQECMADVRGARNVEQFKLYWMMVDQVFAKATNSSKFACNDWLLEKLNLVDLIYHPNGEIRIRPKSIAWEKMEQAHFAEFFSLAIPLIAEFLGTAPKELVAHFESLLDPESRMHFKKIKKLMRVASPSVVPDQETQHEEQPA